MRHFRIIGLVGLLLLGIILSGLAMLSFTARRPANLGVSQGRLANCPSSPNCVSTQADKQDALHWIAPLEFHGTKAEAAQRLRSVLERLPRTCVATDRDGYLHVEFTSRLFRFVDDVEFWINEAGRQIEFRSASRVGHSDLGANRKRMDQRAGPRV
jgi:uncharacterized protein (DUF1499 family)